MTDKNADERLIELETRLAYQEHTIQQLNDIVSTQQKQIDQLTVTLKALVSRFREAAHEASPVEAGNPDSEKPPHY
jgi:SlyX protein